MRDRETKASSNSIKKTGLSKRRTLRLVSIQGSSTNSSLPAGSPPPQALLRYPMQILTSASRIMMTPFRKSGNDNS
jgi:hypothetical protein